MLVSQYVLTSLCLDGLTEYEWCSGCLADRHAYKKPRPSVNSSMVLGPDWKKKQEREYINFINPKEVKANRTQSFKKKQRIKNSRLHLKFYHPTWMCGGIGDTSIISYHQVKIYLSYHILIKWKPRILRTSSRALPQPGNRPRWPRTLLWPLRLEQHWDYIEHMLDM